MVAKNALSLNYIYIHLFVWKGMPVSLRIESVYSTTLFFYSYRDCS